MPQYDLLDDDTRYPTLNHRDQRVFTGAELNALHGALTTDAWLSVAELVGWMQDVSPTRSWCNSSVRRAMNAARAALGNRAAIVSGPKGYKLAGNEAEARAFHQHELEVAGSRLVSAEVLGRAAVTAKQDEVRRDGRETLHLTLAAVKSLRNS